MVTSRHDHKKSKKDSPVHVHEQAHSHDHGHGHNHGHKSVKNAESAKQLKRVMLLTLSFMFVEAIGGYYTNSLALMSDAIHMLTDTAAIGLSLFAFFMSSQPATDSRTFGYYRLEILAAFINGLFLALLSCAVIWGAWTRYHNPVSIKAFEMGIIAFAGLLFNLVGAWLLIKGDPDHLNIRGALFHVLGDALGSVGAIVAAVLVYFFHWDQADSIVSMIIAVIIIASAYRLILDTAHVILEGAPHHLDTDEIRKAIGAIDLIKEVHDLHVWSITSGMVSLSVHVVADEGPRHDLLCTIRDLLKDKFKIEHVTIQIEDKSLKSHEPHI
jgi:cobalt-zinc-cadmium efflux system protein